MKTEKQILYEEFKSKKFRIISLISVFALVWLVIIGSTNAAVTPQNSYNYRDYFSIQNILNISAKNITTGCLTLGGTYKCEWPSSSTSGNSNATLWGMFANITNIMDNATILTYTQSNYVTYYMNNETIMNIINSITTNGTAYYPMNNQTIANALLNSTIVRKLELVTINNTIMNNETIYNMINAVSDNDTTIPAQSNETIGHFISSFIFTGSGLVWNGSQIFATATNTSTVSANSNATLWGMFVNLTNWMNNGTIYDMINAVSDNDTTCDGQSCNIANTGTLDGFEGADLDDWDECADAYACGWLTEETDPHLNNDTTWDYIYGQLSGGSWIVYASGIITATANNGTDGIGNSNATLYGMFIRNESAYITFANLTQIMNNETIYYMINAVSDNDTTIPAQSNETIGHFISSFIFTGSGLVWNGSQMIATAVNLTDTDTNETIRVEAMTNVNCSGTDKMIGFWKNGTIICDTDDTLAGGEADPNLNNATTRNYMYGYFVNLSMWRNNATIYNMINAVSDNDTTIPAQSNETIGHFIGKYIFTGQGLVWNGSQMIATATNGTDGIGNSNATLWGMFANITNVMDNATILNYVQANYLTYYSSNASILNYVEANLIEDDPHTVGMNETTKTYLDSFYATLSMVMNNATILNYITDNFVTYYMNNETILDYVQANYLTYYSSNASILNYVQSNYVTYYMNNQTIANAVINSTIVRPIELITINNTIMNNATIYNMINAVSDNDTDNINYNESVSFYINKTLYSQYMNISGGRFSDDINISFNNVTTVDCITFRSGGKICSG